MHKPGTRLEGRVAIVTGAGTGPGGGDAVGTGVATARLLAQAGARVVVVDRDREAGRRTCELIAADGEKSLLEVADVSDAESCRKVVAAATTAYGSVDVLVNNAAVTSFMPASDMTEEEWSRVIGINLKGAMFMSKWALKAMMAQSRGGAIVNIASGAGLRSFASPAYAASKTGILGLTADLAGTYGRHGVRVNAVVPGMLNTPMAQRIDASERGRKLRSAASPLGTEGTGWDIAWAVLFLAGDEARWITGAVLPVDAGMLVAAPLPTLPFMRDAE